MKLRHATPTANLQAIMIQGLRPDLAVGKIKGCWLHSRAKTPWALLHTQIRKGTALEGLVVLEISVPRSWLTRYQAGLWYCTRVIPPARITGEAPATDWAASPVREN